MAGIELVLCGPQKFAPGAFVDRLLSEAGLEKTWRFTTDPLEAAVGADAVYTDVWVSMGSEDEQQERIEAFRPYQVNEGVMAATNNALFLHCLPAHPGEEVSQAVIESPSSIIFDQAENRLHAQKAILSILANANKTIRK